MSIFRVEKNRNYTCMSNHHLRNDELSYKAIGILSKILSLPDNYKITIQGLAYSVKDGVSAVKSGIDELIAAGYIVRRQVRTANGTFGEYEYDVYEIPQTSGGDMPENAPTGSSETAEEDFTDFYVPPVEDDEFEDYSDYDDEDEEDFYDDELDTQGQIAELDSKVDSLIEKFSEFMEQSAINANAQQVFFAPKENPISVDAITENGAHINTKNINTDYINNNVYNNHINLSNTVRTTGTDGIDRTIEHKALTDVETYEKYEELIKKNIGYDDFVISSSYDDLEQINEIVYIMTDTVAFNTAPISINGSLIPAEIVKSRFLKITGREIEYVLFALSRTTTKIHNIRKYLIAALYNARCTNNHFYGAEVRHDMYGV